jgi:hypothetical protein
MVEQSMMSRSIDLVGALAFACIASGCAIEPDTVIDDEDSESLTSNALTSNALTSNALTSNALTSNALTSNALTSNALTSNALTSETLSDPEQGQKAALVIRYSARCMLSPDQSVTVTFVDHDGAEQTRTYYGNLGLEPTWIEGELSAEGRRWWAGCLGAHINAYGTPVSVSVRGPHPSLTLTGVERDDYLIREGAFWADYDPEASPALHIYSCFDPANSDAAYERYRKCANESCGEMMTVVGPCNGQSPACESAHAPDDQVGDYFQGCHPAPGPSWPDVPHREIVTANLRL